MLPALMCWKWDLIERSFFSTCHLSVRWPRPPSSSSCDSGSRQGLINERAAAAEIKMERGEQDVK